MLSKMERPAGGALDGCSGPMQVEDHVYLEW